MKNYTVTVEIVRVINIQAENENEARSKILMDNMIYDDNLIDMQAVSIKEIK